jgi:hypothetical protein
LPASRPSAKAAHRTSCPWGCGPTTPSTSRSTSADDDFAGTKKYRDVERTGRAAIVIDDLASTDPWRPRGIEIRGRAEAIAEPRPLIRIHPEGIVSWGIESEAVGVRHSRSVARSDRPKGGAR